MKISQYKPVYSGGEAKAAYEYLINDGWCGDHDISRQFEDVIRAYTRSKYSVVVSSGTAALQIAIMALKLHDNAIILVPDYTMPATAYAASLRGYRTIFMDVDINTYNINRKTATKAIYEYMAEAIIPVNINGRCDYNAQDIAYWNSHELHVIEDACQGMGSWHNGQHLGTFGDIGVLSLNLFKLISTGQGGILLTENEELYNQVRKIKDYGRLGGRGAEYEILGMNAKYNDLLAVIGIKQFQKIEQKRTAKKQIWKWYTDRLSGIEQVKFISTDLDECTPWYIDPLVEKRNELIQYLAQNDIETQPFYPPLHRLKYYQYLNYKDNNFPGACYVSDNGIWLPSSINLIENTVDMICEKIRRFYSPMPNISRIEIAGGEYIKGDCKDAE